MVFRWKITAVCGTLAFAFSTYEQIAGFLLAPGLEPVQFFRFNMLGVGNSTCVCVHAFMLATIHQLH